MLIYQIHFQLNKHKKIFGGRKSVFFLFHFCVNKVTYDKYTVW